ncbi:MAG: hypothetical protein IH830_07270 [Planctomycetes bacterium]|nr:hypothetical protein [Planctomycetota bacterium]
MRRFSRLVVRAVSAITISAAILAPAIAWAQQTVDPPTLRRSQPVWLGYLIIVVLLALVMLVSLMPSKRGHQD